MHRGAQFNKEVFVLLVNKELFNPIEVATEVPDEFFQKYIDIRDRQYAKMPTSPEMIAEVKNRFFDSHRNVDKAQLRKIWEPIRGLVERNKAFAQFVLDNGGAESEFFFPWIISVATSPSEALELSYNSGRNLKGEWVTDIPADDNINYFVHNLPTLAYNRERQLKVADLVTADRDRMSAGEQSKILDLGAGRMAWARYHGFEFKPGLQQIMACDKDPTIQPSVFSVMYGKDQETSHELRFYRKAPDSSIKFKLLPFNLTYEKRDILDELGNPECKDASLAILQGIPSYYPIDYFEGSMVRPIYGLLRDGGKFFFDLQLHHISYEWSVKVFNWPEMKLPDKVAEVEDAVEAMRLRLWRNGIRFETTEYALGTYGGSPVSVMVLLTKV